MAFLSAVKSKKPNSLQRQTAYRGLPVQGPQAGELFPLMFVHANHDVHQRFNGIEDIRAFIQHDAFRPDRHGRIGKFRPGAGAFLAMDSSTWVAQMTGT